jgi:hypothetical protein
MFASACACGRRESTKAAKFDFVDESRDSAEAPVRGACRESHSV